MSKRQRSPKRRSLTGFLSGEFISLLLGPLSIVVNFFKFMSNGNGAPARRRKAPSRKRARSTKSCGRGCGSCLMLLLILAVFSVIVSLFNPHHEETLSTANGITATSPSSTSLCNGFKNSEEVALFYRIHKSDLRGKELDRNGDGVPCNDTSIPSTNWGNPIRIPLHASRG